MKLRSVVAWLALLLPTSASQASVIDTTAGLVYHLDAAVANVTKDGSNKVSAWNDTSGNLNHFLQGSAGKQPTWIASVAGFNNLPVIRFDGDLSGNSNGVAPNADRLVLSSATTAQTVFIVETPTAQQGLDGIWGLNDQDTGIRRQNATDWQTQATGNGNDFATSMYVNGVLTSAQSLNSPAVISVYGNLGLSATGLGEYFLVSPHTPRPFTGDIAEVAVYSGTLSEGERQAIETYLFNKYFVPVPEPGSLALLGLGAICLCRGARRRRKV